MTTSKNSIYTESEPESSENSFPTQLLERLVHNLSCNLSSNPLDLIHSGIQIYDPFIIDQTFKPKPVLTESKSTRAISLRSKSTRNLNLRNNSFSNLLKSFRLVLEKVEVDDRNISKNLNISYYDELNRSKSRQKLNPINERRKKKSPGNTKQNKNILQDVYNVKNKKVTKSVRNSTKDIMSRRSYLKKTRISSLTPSKFL
jgi:hypothetical protein